MSMYIMKGIRSRKDTPVIQELECWLVTVTFAEGDSGTIVVFARDSAHAISGATDALFDNDEVSVARSMIKAELIQSVGCPGPGIRGCCKPWENEALLDTE